MADTKNNADESVQGSRISNLAIGFLLVIAAFLAYNFFRTDTDNVNDKAKENENIGKSITEVLQENDLTEEEVIGEQALIEEDLELSDDEYVVKEGDTLWEIAENELGDGFLWEELAGVNDLNSSSKLSVGTVLTLPVVSSATIDNTNEPEVEVAETPDEEIAAVEEEEENLDTEEVVAGSDQVYVVVQGDTLWDIAARFYGDGARWNEIFDYGVNNLSLYQAQDGSVYPIIHSGNVLIIPGATNTTP